jgi:curved DNA-binding protein CbpA
MLDRPSDQNYYQVLEISERATTEEIQSAYERAREVYASDSVVSASILTPEERRQILERVTEAYHTLIAEESRRLYDQKLTRSTEPAPERPSPIPPSPSPSPSPSVSDSSAAPALAYPRLVEIPPRSEEEPMERFKIMLGVKEEATGAFLKKAREAAGVDLRSISQETKIGVTMLGYIEDERLDRLPAAVYLKNFVQQYARFLGLEDERVARSYMARIRRLQSR